MSGNGATDTAPAEFAEFRAEQFEQVKTLFESAGTGSTDAALGERIRAEFPRTIDNRAAAIATFRDLLRLEERPERFRRLLRAWSTKVTGHIKQMEWKNAGAWMGALTQQPVFPPDFAVHVNEALRELSREEQLNELVIALAKAKDPPTAASLLAAWGDPLVEYLINGMLVDEPPVNRRHLVEYLGMAGRADVRLLTPWLRDPRWYIVRNVATAIGKTGRENGIEPLMAVRQHPDDRVRVEAVRALAALQGEGALDVLVEGLRDESQRVRNAAVSLLRALPADEVVYRIADHLSEGDVEDGDARRLMKVIAERPSRAATDALERLASKRFAVGTAKTVRDMARMTLDRRS